MKSLFVLVLGILLFSACRKECEKLTDSTLFQFGAVQCKFWDKDTIDLKLYARYGNTKGQLGVPSPICYDKFIAQFSSKKLGECELYQEKEATQPFLIYVKAQNERGQYFQQLTIFP